MVDSVLNIINKALVLNNTQEVTLSELKSANESHHKLALQKITDFYKDLIREKAYEFKSNFDLSTVSNQKNYAVTFPPRFLINFDKVTVIEPLEGKSYSIDFLNDSKVRFRFPNPDADITSTGKPENWFFWNNEIRFYPIPDKVYTVRFRKLEQITSDLTAESSTACNELGDRLLVVLIARALADSIEGFNSQKYDHDIHYLTSEYLLSQTDVNYSNTFKTPPLGSSF